MIWRRDERISSGEARKREEKERWRIALSRFRVEMYRMGKARSRDEKGRNRVANVLSRIELEMDRMENEKGRKDVNGREMEWWSFDRSGFEQAMRSRGLSKRSLELIRISFETIRLESVQTRNEGEWS